MGEYVYRISFTELDVVRVTQNDKTVWEASIDAIAELPRDAPASQSRVRIPETVYVALVDFARALRDLRKASPEGLEFTIAAQENARSNGG